MLLYLFKPSAFGVITTKKTKSSVNESEYSEMEYGNQFCQHILKI